MPLRDHFRPPVSKKSSWEGFHAVWPTTIIQHLRGALPSGFVAEPRVHLGAFFEVDIGTFEPDVALPSGQLLGDGGTANWTAEPAVAVETELEGEAEYEVRVYDATRERQLVATIELVSPANKDRPEKRNAFVAKCAALIRQGVAVTIVDVVTVRHFNLYAELMEFLGHPDGTLGADPPATYAGTCRRVPRGDRAVLQAWPFAIAVGQPLPTIPLWLGADRVLVLDLEPSYERACHDLWIT